MPNHIHGILNISTDPDIPYDKSDEPHGVMPGSIGAIVGNFKMLVTKRVKNILKVPGTDLKVWQRGYWERIVRNERELHAIREYIINNPNRWEEDRDIWMPFWTKCFTSMAYKLPWHENINGVGARQSG